MENFKEVSGQYIQVKTDKNTLHLKIGRVFEQQNLDGYAVEIIDWVGNTNLFTHRMDFDNTKIVTFPYTLSYNTKLINEEEFNKALADQMIWLSRTQKLDDAFYLDFKRTEERIAFLRSYMDLIKYYERKV